MHTTQLWIFSCLLLSSCSVSLSTGFETYFCDERTNVYTGYKMGYLRYNSSLEDTRYDWCSCQLCDTSQIKGEDTASFHPQIVLLQKPTQTFNYSYPHGQTYIKGSWSNNTVEGTIGASLYTRCTTFTLTLKGNGAQVQLNMDFKSNRSEITMTCEVGGLLTISDTDAGEQISPREFNNVGVAIGVGVAAIMIVFAVAGLCVYFKLGKRRGSSALAKDDYDQPPSVHNSTYGDPRPEIHRNIDTTAMSKNAVSFLEETPASNEYFVSPDPGYEAVGTPESEVSPDNSGYDNSAFSTEDEVPPSFYHTLTEDRPQSQLVTAETDNIVKAKQDTYLKPRDSVISKQEQEDTTSDKEEENHYEDVGMPRETREDTDLTNLDADADEKSVNNPHSFEDTEGKDTESLNNNVAHTSEVLGVEVEYAQIHKPVKQVVEKEEVDEDTDDERDGDRIVTEL